MLTRAHGFKATLWTLRAHKVRAALALLATAVGVGTLLLVLFVGEGTKADVLAHMEALGTNVLTVSAGQAQIFAGRPRFLGNVTTLRLQDAEAIEAQCPSVQEVAPAVALSARLKYGNQSWKTNVVGTTPSFGSLRNVEFASGRFFLESEVQGALRVVVLGDRVAKELFAQADPVGQQVIIDRTPFQVIGVTVRKGIASPLGQDEDDRVLVPIKTALRRLLNQPQISSIYVKVWSEELIAQATKELRTVLRAHHHLREGRRDDFTVFNEREMLDTQAAIGETFSQLLVGIAALALMVGGLGVLSVMLLAVRERRAEIGVRRAVGAQHKDILWQFLQESVLLTAVGGALGVVAGLLGSLVVASWTQWPLRVSWNTVLLAYLFAAGLGILFGVYPARRAARLDPIEALQAGST